MRFAILGGSFNPVHIGHLALAGAVLANFDYDRLILIPAFQSPFKTGDEYASSKDRMDILAASIAGDPRLTIDDCEIRRAGVSYTIDTLKDIIARYKPSGKPGLVLGNDLASTFSKWRDPGEIAELADIIIAQRKPETGMAPNGDEYDCGKYSSKGEARDFPYPYKLLNNEIIDVSSSLVREKIKEDKDWRYLVPAGARYMIESRSLYGYSAEVSEKTPPGITEIIIRIENDVRKTLSQERFIHSRNTALLSWDLCRRFKLDAQSGYLAGIAHDMCKNLSDKEFFRMVHSDGKNISKLEQEKPSLLHARAAAVLLKRKYGVTNSDIIEAVRYHTTGSMDMGALAKVVYIADKIEISRGRVGPELREMSQSADLETLFAAVLDNTVAYLKSHQREVSYGTKRLLLAMQKRKTQ